MKIRKVNLIYLIIAVIFSIAIDLMTKIKFSGAIYGSITENNIDLNFSILDAILCFIMILASYGIFCGLEKIVCTVIGLNIRIPRWVPLCWFVLVFLFWSVYYLNFYPGGVYSDTLSSIWMAMNDSINSNHHPVLYSYSLKWIMDLADFGGHNIIWAIGLYTFLQMLAMLVSFLYFIYWQMRRRVNGIIVIITMLFLGFFPLIPLNGISVWKDTPFSIWFFLYVLCVIDIWHDCSFYNLKIISCIKTYLITVILCLSRNNGIYIAFVTSVVFILMSLKLINKYKKIIMCYGCMVLSIVTVMIIQGPIFGKIGIQKTETEESLGILIQQVARVVVYDGEINENQKSEIEKIIPCETIKKVYAPAIVDPIKWDSSYNKSYITKNKKQFIKLWLELFLQNPKIYFESYLLSTCGYWAFNCSSLDIYVQNYMWPNEVGLKNTNLFKRITGKDLSGALSPKKAVNAAIFLWITIACSIIKIKRSGFKSCIFYIPSLLLWATLMIASPVAVCMRYMFPLVLTTPICISIVFVDFGNQNMNEIWKEKSCHEKS